MYTACEVCSKFLLPRESPSSTPSVSEYPYLSGDKVFDPKIHPSANKILKKFMHLNVYYIKC